uniref:C->U-editing enzyme APOBEC-1 n=1 Tax=Capra hircus TaxID=9925 RepID=A0A452E9Z9_CAPHI
MASDRGKWRRIEPLEFEFSFDPRNFCKEAYLLYEIQWGNSRDVWRHSGKNTTKHVERNFIEKIASERHFHPSISCSIFWYLSWSPCWECSKAIREFLNQHPNVTLVIYIARLFQHTDPQNRQGLKDLWIQLSVLCICVSLEYDYCWRNFVNYPQGKEAHWPRYPPLWMNLYALELYCIISGLPPCLQISRRYQNQLRVFRLIPQNCHYQMIPPCILLATGMIQLPVTWRWIE